MATAQTNRTKGDIADILNALPFVLWDRCTVAGDETTIYGWIDRRDGRKDFVLVQFTGPLVGFTTSSARWSRTIHEVIYGPRAGDHNDCRRVVDEFAGAVDHAVGDRRRCTANT